MIKILRISVLLATSLFTVPILVADNISGPLTLDSPDARLQVTFKLNDMGRAVCDVAYRDTLVASGAFGLSFKGSGLLQDNLKVIGADRSSRDETYLIPVGKASSARDHHNELVTTDKSNAASQVAQ